MKCEFAVLTDPNVHWMQKIKEVDLYSAFIVVPHTQGAQAWDHTVLPANYTVYLPLPRKHSPDGASPN